MDKNFDNEVLSMEELDNVAGGTLREMSLDLEFLRDIGFNVKWRSNDYIYNHSSDVIEELASTWQKAGVYCTEISDGDYTHNVYRDKENNIITRAAAMKKAMDFKKVSLDNISKYF